MPSSWQPNAMPTPRYVTLPDDRRHRDSLEDDRTHKPRGRPVAGGTIGV
jgi:hypothetical protein